MSVQSETNLPDEAEADRVVLAGNLVVGEGGLDGIHSVRDVVDHEEHGLVGRRKGVAPHIFPHLGQVVLEVAENVVDNVVVGSGSDHELQESGAEVEISLLSLGCHVGGKCLEAAVGVVNMSQVLQRGVRFRRRGGIAHDDLVARRQEGVAVEVNLVGESVTELLVGMTYVLIETLLLHEMGRSRSGEELDRTLYSFFQNKETRNIPSCRMTEPSHP
jgi:hypothetical protein